MDEYWRNFDYYHRKHNAQQVSCFPTKQWVILYGCEVSLLQQKLLSHQVSVPQFFRSPNDTEGDDITKYLKWVIVAMDNSKRLFPSIVRRPVVFTPNIINESFYRFGVSLPF